MAVASALVCSEAGSGGGSDPDPVDPVGACNDYCDRLSQCGWYLIDFGDPCNKHDYQQVSLCHGIVAFFEGEDESCDEAAAAYFKCGKKASCVSLEGEPCSEEYAKMGRECPFAFGKIPAAKAEE